MATIDVKTLSEELDTTPRIARKFLRATTPSEKQPGKGGRWQIEKREVRGLKKKFEQFQHEHMRQLETPTDEVDIVLEDETAE